VKILILGGYGTFGGRLAHLLAGEARVSLMIAGRSLRKAQDFIAGLPAGAPRTAVAFDRDGDVQAQLHELRPDLVVDASGPFQSYGRHPYRVVEGCIAVGINYMDLADGSDFVRGIPGYDAAARARNVYVLTGVSSFPVLTAAVVRRLAQDLSKIQSITGGIAPSPYAGVGLNVLRAIAGYAGKRVALVRHGRPAAGHALTESMRYTIAPPGYLPLRRTLFSLVDVPDLQVLPELWPGVDSVWMGAGPVPEVLHRMLIGLAWLVRLRLLPTLRPLAPLFHYVINLLRWGEHRGGMFVRVQGADAQGRPIERSWHLLAEKDDGPLIPSMAVEALVRRALAGNPPPPGARAATRDLELEHYEESFSRRSIYTGQRETSAATPQPVLYRRLLGSAFEALPAPLQALHDCAGEQRTTGRARVDRGRNPLAQLAAWVMGFPQAGQDLPVQVVFRPERGGEVWTRTFADTSFSSLQTEGRGASERLLSERLGPFTFGIGLVLDGDRLRLITRRWSLLGLPLPVFLAPRGSSYEYAADGRFWFHVEIAHPLTGLIVRYHGWLERSS
jgi:hypothetical protein